MGLLILADAFGRFFSRTFELTTDYAHHSINLGPKSLYFTTPLAFNAADGAVPYIISPEVIYR